MLSLTIMAITFGVVFLAELPDKTALAGLMLLRPGRRPVVIRSARRR